MKKTLTAVLSLALCLPAPVQADESDAKQATQVVIPAGSQPSEKAPANIFTGTARVERLFSAPAPARTGVATVTFEPGARSAWHTHPLGQILVVISGLGRAQAWGGPIQEIRPGDVVWCPPGVKHWHGAAPHTAMSHYSIVEDSAGNHVTWMEKVTDEQYAGR